MLFTMYASFTCCSNKSIDHYVYNIRTDFRQIYCELGSISFPLPLSTQNFEIYEIIIFHFIEWKFYNIYFYFCRVELLMQFLHTIDSRTTFSTVVVITTCALEITFIFPSSFIALRCLCYDLCCSQVLQVSHKQVLFHVSSFRLFVYSIANNWSILVSLSNWYCLHK
jgi:hypothetical protein